MSAVFGVHLGDYQAVLAVHKNGKTEVLANEAGERETPMIVTYKDDNVIIGSLAKQALYRNWRHTAHSMPSLMTTSTESVHFAKITQSSNCKIIVKDTPSQVCYEFDQPSSSSSRKSHHVTVTDSLTRILKDIFATAKSFAPSTAISCVLSVPVYYNEDQKSTLKQCVESSGFSVLSTAVSPALSLLPYGIDKDLFSGHVLVFDMGTRTLTLTILNCIRGMMRIVDSSTTFDLGGSCLDELIVGILKDECKRVFRKDLSDNERAAFKLLAAAETVKHSLSTQQTANVSVESLHDGMDLQCSIARGRFEGVCHHIFQSCQEPLHKILNSTNLTNSDIDKVVLVGGACKIPRLQKLLQEWFPSSEILWSVSPEHIVAIGAALQGECHVKYLESINDIPQSIPCTSQDIWIHCIDCIEPVGVVLMHRHTPLPSRSKININFKPVEIDKNISLTVREGSGENERDVTKIEVPSNFDHLEVEMIWNTDNNVVLTVRDIYSDYKSETNLFVEQ